MEKQGINCHNCGNFGHYAKNCPRNSDNENKKRKTSASPYSNASSTQKFPATYCRCGGDHCRIKRIPKSGEPFYSCPNSYEMHCGYFKWCKKLKKEEILHKRQPPFPRCPCGAGVCRLETEKITGRKYFACRIQKGQGACNFWQWEEDYYQTIAAASWTIIASDDDINTMLREIEDGLIDLDYPFETEINASDETFRGDKEAHQSPSPSPTSPLDMQPATSPVSPAVVVRWFPRV